ncbi:MAG: helix-turn-helix domain-containing protein [Salipiger thiooxidans]|uniref:helix-turn-helix domain-containing protein n=1 Tax=Salipiger thiooxidans TaxID=282683 RepID=UPI001CFA2C51|nr:helix-turn-helix transcriptional regulator [Salipiger thiooxidans]
MTQLYVERMYRSIRQTNNYTDAGIAGIVPVCDTADMKNLARIRKTRGFSQAKLAELSGVKQATISRIESGTNNPSLDTADKIAAALQVSTVELFGLPELEQRFLEAFRSATPERRAALLTLLESDQ